MFEGRRSNAGLCFRPHLDSAFAAMSDNLMDQMFAVAMGKRDRRALFAGPPASSAEKGQKSGAKSSGSTVPTPRQAPVEGVKRTAEVATESDAKKRKLPGGWVDAGKGKAGAAQRRGPYVPVLKPSRSSKTAQALQVKSTKSRSEPKGKGSFADLPYELVLRILSLLPPHVIVRSRRVSSFFLNAADDPSVWHSVEFHGATVPRLMSKSRERLHTAIPDTALRLLAQRISLRATKHAVRGFVNLCISDFGQLASTGTISWLSPDALSACVSGAHRISLRTLELEQIEMGERHWRLLLELEFPGLEELIVVKTSWLGTEPWQLAARCPRLSRLTVLCGIHNMGFPDDQVARRLVSLRTDSLRAAIAVTNGLEMPALEALDLDYTDRSQSLLLPHNLKNVTLRHAAISGAGLIRTFAHLPNLEHIELLDERHARFVGGGVSKFDVRKLWKEREELAEKARKRGEEWAKLKCVRFGRDEVFRGP